MFLAILNDIPESGENPDTTNKTFGKYTTTVKNFYKHLRVSP